MCQHPCCQNAPRLCTKPRAPGLAGLGGAATAPAGPTPRPQAPSPRLQVPICRHVSPGPQHQEGTATTPRPSSRQCLTVELGNY